MAKIEVMSEVLANKIAAGEIIERPLSVVKELVENALDANASRIIITLKESGLQEISVLDDGFGMNKADLEKSILRHATSKLYSDKDLFNIGTLGFRGEALASMFVVSKMEITSSIDGKDGHKLISSGDGNYIMEECAFNQGTEVCVKNLFFNTPVRYKHLSNLMYELSLIINYLNKISLCYPNIAIKLINDGKESLSTSGRNDIKEVVAQVYSYDIARSLKLNTIKSDNFDVNVVFAGLEYTRTKKSFITIFINERLISNYHLEKQILESLSDYLHTNQYPIFILKIKMDYALVDVNIHPNKQQVKISLIEELCQQVSETIKGALVDDHYIVDGHLDKRDNSSLNLDFAEKKNYNYNIEPLELDLQKTHDVSEVKWQLPIFNYIGTYKNTYLLFENNEGLFLIDQHAAQERINYELILNKFKSKKFNVQKLLLPIVLELPKNDRINIIEILKLYEELGIIVEEFGEQMIRVIAIDNFYLKSGNLENDILNLFELISKNKKIEFDKYNDELAESLACKGSIKANQYINSADVEQLMKDLNECEFAYTCPHGRPIIVNIKNYEIEKLFKRVF